MKIAVAIIILVFLSAISLAAGTAYFGTELGIEGYEESEWSDPGSFTVEGNSFGSEFVFLSNSSGGGWIPNPSNDFIPVAVAVLFFAGVAGGGYLVVKNGIVKNGRWAK